MQFRGFDWLSHYGIWAISINLLVLYRESVHLMGYITVDYVTIRLRARVFYEQIVNEA